MEQIESELNMHPARERYFKLKRGKGQHCLEVEFYPTTPTYLMKGLAFEVKERCYPGIRVVEDYYSRNLYNFRICLDCEDVICGMVDHELVDDHHHRSGIAEY